jgi:hypothetical protein
MAPIFPKLKNPVKVILDNNDVYSDLRGNIVSMEETPAGDFLVLADDGDTDVIYYIRVSKIVCVENFEDEE